MIMSKRDPLYVTEEYRHRRLAAIRQRWDERAQGWDESLTAANCHLNIEDAHRRFLRFAIRHAVPRGRSHAVALDLGCGTGAVTATLAPRCAWTVGLDVSPEMVRIARHRGLPSADFVIGDGFAMPFPDARFDVVVSRGVLVSHYGLNNSRDLLREVFRVLACGGAFVFDFLNGQAAPSSHVAYGKQLFHAAEIAKVAGHVGLRVKHVSGRPTARTRFMVLSKPRGPSLTRTTTANSRDRSESPGRSTPR